MTWDVLDDISPMSPYYKDDDEQEKFMCCFCYHDFYLDCMIVEDGKKYCQECHEYNQQIEDEE